MIPVSNKTRSITRVRYKHAPFWRQEKCERDFSAAVACAVLSAVIKSSYPNSAEDSGRYNKQKAPPSHRQGRLTCSAKVWLRSQNEID
jgi:hypothetical protein